jgi:hypothetical protein
MIEDLKVTLCQPRRRCSAPEASESIAWASAESFYKHLGWTAGAEQDQHGGCAWFKKRSKPLGYGANVLHAVERCKVGECSIEKRFTSQATLVRKALYVFAGGDVGRRAQRGELLSGNVDHGRRRIREKHSKTAFRKECRIFTGASADFQHVSRRGKLLQESSAHCPALCGDARPRTKSIVERGSDRVEGKRCGPERYVCHCRLLLSRRQRRDSTTKRSPSTE